MGADVLSKRLQSLYKAGLESDVTSKSLRKTFDLFNEVGLGLLVAEAPDLELLGWYRREWTVFQDFVHRRFYNTIVSFENETQEEVLEGIKPMSLLQAIWQLDLVLDYNPYVNLHIHRLLCEVMRRTEAPCFLVLSSTVGAALGLYTESLTAAYLAMGNIINSAEVTETMVDGIIPNDAPLVLLKDLPMTQSKGCLVADKESAFKLKLAEAIETAYMAAVLKFKGCKQLTALLQGDRLLQLKSPLMFTHTFTSKFDDSTDLEGKIDALSGLFDIITHDRLGLEASNTVNIISELYNFLQPEVFTLTNRSRYLSCLISIAKSFSQNQAMAFMRKSLSVACVTPAHAAIWLVVYARYLYSRGQGECFAPLVNAAIDQPQKVVFDYNNKDIINCRLWALEVLSHHSAKAVRHEVREFLVSVSPLKLEEDLKKMLDLSYIDIVLRSGSNLLLRCAVSFFDSSSSSFRKEQLLYKCDRISEVGIPHKRIHGVANTI